MNDSFLEDLDLVPKDASGQNNSQVNRHITTRKVLTPPVNNRSKQDNLESKHDKIISSSSTNLTKAKITRRSGSQEPRKKSVSEGKPLSSTPKSERRSLIDENTNPIEDQIKAAEVRVKSNDTKLASKVKDGKSVNDRKCTSGSSGSISKCLEVSTKENSRPFTDTSSSRESGSQTDLKKSAARRGSDNAMKSDILEKTDPVVLLTAIKELVSRYTEQETVKVLRAMQNLHVNSQANLIKQLMSQTSELIDELSVNKNYANVRSLIEENERMREDIFILQTRNEVLQKRIDEMALLREENISLKLKLKELQQ